MTTKELPHFFSLYRLSVDAVVVNHKLYSSDFSILPPSILCDIYFAFHNRKEWMNIVTIFNDVFLFRKLLRVNSNYCLLLSTCMDLLKNGNSFHMKLAINYGKLCMEFETIHTDEKYANKLISVGLELGTFTRQIGWFFESYEILTRCYELCLTLPPCVDSWLKALDCCRRTLRTVVEYDQIDVARYTKKKIEQYIRLILNGGYPLLLSPLYADLARFWFKMCNYNEAFKWSCNSVISLKESDNWSVSHLIDVYNLASRACLSKRRYKEAEAFIKQSMYLTQKYYGENHPKYSETLKDFGYYLLNSDNTKESVEVYERALSIKQSIFGNSNLYVALANEDLAYALYVFNYSSGKFDSASKHANLAISIMKEHFSEDHLMLCSAERVRALILEEIALSLVPGFENRQLILLKEAENLHKANLKLTLRLFGEENVLTAKHYGNLGRLYQSMKFYKEAEQMHIKAIAIKEKLLGKYDYEVGLSIAHLASLYNYDMREFQKAKELYYRSIEISVKLFSDSYSGLVFDYRGLFDVYQNLGDSVKAVEFHTLLIKWKVLRNIKENKSNQPLEILCTSLYDIDELISILNKAIDELGKKECVEDIVQVNLKRNSNV